MKQEETLFKASYDFMRKRGYKITKNSRFNEYKTDIIKFTAYPDCTTITSYLNEEEWDEYFLINEEDIIKIEEEEKENLREEVKYCESLTEENRTEDDYSDYWIEKILSLKKYL